VIVTIPEVLREKLGSEGARALADLLNEASVQTRGDVIELTVSRFESRLAEEIGALRGDMVASISALRGDLNAGLAELRGEFDAKIGDLRAEMGRFEGRITRWMFVFWIGQIGVLLAMFFAFFRA
jgi:hypothetical protein